MAARSLRAPARLRSSPSESLQPMCTSSLKLASVRISHDHDSGSSRSASAGQRMRAAPALASFLHLGLSGSCLSVVPLAICAIGASGRSEHHVA